MQWRLSPSPVQVHGHTSSANRYDLAAGQSSTSCRIETHQKKPLPVAGLPPCGTQRS